ncbi:hypothetical protein B6D29_01510 [Microgenomates bacterium UTCPR1]|nr:PrgI family protein [Patescibacteria group bacterium]OQY67877.1 MAG: hypothetical protein B6D29_01510 [Microgenomates bacterium UTCPR1]
MDQHPIPRQITTFEFKLIGFLTIKQFIYLVVFIGFGLLVYTITPIPILNYLLAFLVSMVGVAFAFVPINDRPMENWVRNLIKRLTSPTQYIFKKENKPIAALLNSSYSSNAQQIATYIDSQKKLNSYLSTKNPKIEVGSSKRQSINSLLMSSFSFLTNKKPINPPSQPQPSANIRKTTVERQPFITGTIKNFKQTPLAGILIYVKKSKESPPIRIFKTNLHGIFLSYKSFPSDEYIFEIKDPKQIYFFDTMKIKVENNNKPIEVTSRELI